MLRLLIGGVVTSLAPLLAGLAVNRLFGRRPTVRVGRAVVSIPPYGMIEALTITVQNRTERVLYLGNVFLELQTGDRCMPRVDRFTGYRQGRPVALAPGNSFALHILAADLARYGYPPSAFRCAAVEDAVDRVYRSSAAELQKALRRYCRQSP